MNSIIHNIKTKLGKLLPTNKYLTRLIWFSCISVVIPVVLAGSVYYHFSMKQLTKEFQENNKVSLKQLEYRIESALANVEQESLQLASDPLIRKTLGQAGYASDMSGQLEILDYFQLHKNMNDLIQEFIFFDEQSALALSSYYGLASLEEFPGASDIQSAMKIDEMAGWFYLPQSGGKGLISYVRQLPVMGNGDPQGVLIIHVDEAALRSLLKSYSVDLEKQTVAVVDSNNRIILHTLGQQWLGQDAASDSYLQSVLGREERTDQYVLDNASGAMLLAYDKNLYGRTYISQLPEEEMYGQLAWIRILIFVSVSIVLLIGLMLSFFSSRFVYNPIQKLLQYGEHLRKNGADDNWSGNEIEYIRSCLSYLNDQAQSLNEYVMKIQPGLREQFLQKQLRAAGGRYAIAEACQQYGIPANGRYVAVVTMVENLLKEKRFMPHEGAVIVFAVKNVMAEIMTRHTDINGYVVDLDEREAVAIIHFDEGIADTAIRHALQKYCSEVREAMSAYLSFSVSSGIGHLVKLEELSASYSSAQHALQFRLFHDADTILFHEDIIRVERHPVFIYPREHEESIMESLWNGELSSAEESLQKFTQRVSNAESYNVLFQCYQVLLSSIIQSLEEKGPGVLELLGNNLFDQLSQYRTSKEVHDWFIDVLFPLYERASSEIRANSSRLLVQRVCSYITNHPDGTHSLSECAELVSVSPSYLSRLFKKETGKSFIEFVMEFKVEKAKQLLKETDYSVLEISEIVGYSERNLNRAFQRFVQMSPKQYRMSNR
ncbi:helix-turn-helix domain-containing protein [Paenibacillus sp. strain BS8-2]